MRIALLVALLLPDGCRGGGKASKALLRQFCARGLLAVDDRRGDTCVDKAGKFAGCPPGRAPPPPRVVAAQPGGRRAPV